MEIKLIWLALGLSGAWLIIQALTTNDSIIEKIAQRLVGMGGDIEASG